MKTAEPAAKMLVLRQSRSLQFRLKLRLVKLFGISCAVASLLAMNPAVGQPLSSAPTEMQSASPTLQPEAATRSDRQPAPVKRTALFSPELDATLANGLIWISYLGLPLGLIVVIRYHDRQVQEQMVKLVEQVAVLERIWQDSQVH